MKLFKDLQIKDQINVKIHSIDEHDLIDNDGNIDYNHPEELKDLIQEGHVLGSNTNMSSTDEINTMLYSKFLLHILDNTSEQNLLQKLSLNRVVFCINYDKY